MFCESNFLENVNRQSLFTLPDNYAEAVVCYYCFVSVMYWYVLGTRLMAMAFTFSRNINKY